jgi:hypothetical protein
LQHCDPCNRDGSRIVGGARRERACNVARVASADRRHDGDGIGIEVAVWTLAYAIVGVAPPGTDLFYFAFVNYTTLGYGDVTPLRRWELLGPMTAMNGVLLFGWSTAVIFAVLRAVMTRQTEEELRPRADEVIE